MNNLLTGAEMPETSSRSSVPRADTVPLSQIHLPWAAEGNVELPVTKTTPSGVLEHVLCIQRMLSCLTLQEIE